MSLDVSGESTRQLGNNARERLYVTALRHYDAFLGQLRLHLKRSINTLVSRWLVLASASHSTRESQRRRLHVKPMPGHGVPGMEEESVEYIINKNIKLLKIRIRALN